MRKVKLKRTIFFCVMPLEDNFTEVIEINL